MIRILAITRAIIVRLTFPLLIICSLALLAISYLQYDIFVSLRRVINDMAAPVIDVMTVPLHAARTIYITAKAYPNSPSPTQAIDTERLQERLLALEAENQQLKALLHMLPSPEWNYKTARIVAHNGEHFRHLAVINSGNNNGLETGQIALFDNQLIGTIIDVGTRHATLLLVTDVNASIPVITQNSGERAILKGNNSSEPTLHFVSTHNKIAVGEKIVTSGDGRFYPAGIVVGRVSDVSTHGIHVAPTIDWNDLVYVNIIENIS